MPREPRPPRVTNWAGRREECISSSDDGWSCWSYEGPTTGLTDTRYGLTGCVRHSKVASYACLFQLLVGSSAWRGRMQRAFSRLTLPNYRSEYSSCHFFAKSITRTSGTMEFDRPLHCECTQSDHCDLKYNCSSTCNQVILLYFSYRALNDYSGQMSEI